MADRALIPIRITLFTEDWRSQLAVRMCWMHSATLNALIDKVQADRLPVSKTECRKAVRQTARFIPAEPGEYGPRYTPIPKPEFTQVAMALAHELLPSDLVDIIMQYEPNLTQRFFTVTRVEG